MKWVMYKRNDKNYPIGIAISQENKLAIGISDMNVCVMRNSREAVALIGEMKKAKIVWDEEEENGAV